MFLKVKEQQLTKNLPRLNALGCVMIMGALLLVAFMVFGHHKAEATNSVRITARVGAPLPSLAANITSPQSGQGLPDRTTEVRGTCQPRMYITILSDNLVRGGTICSDEGRFNQEVRLRAGESILTAQTNDGIDQSGPESKPVKVFVPTGLGADFKLNINKSYQRIGQSDTLSWEVSLVGNASIYAVRVDWGDGQSDLVPTTEKALTLSHKYDRSGVRIIKISASDDKLNSDSLSLVASISSLATLNQGSAAEVGSNLFNPVLYVTVLLMTASFIVGNYYHGGKKYVWAKEQKQETTEVA